MENALGLSGGQATLIAITAGFTILGLVGLAAAMFMEKRWKVSYSFEFLFIIGMLVLVYYADWNSKTTYKAYQAELRQWEEVAGTPLAKEDRKGVFDQVINVAAFQWGFAFINENNELSRNAAIVQPGEKVLFRVMSNDVIHGFNIPVANIVAEIDPGDVRELWIRAPDKPGKYLIQCVNYCGVGHAQMKAWLVVQGADEDNEETSQLDTGEGTSNG